VTEIGGHGYYEFATDYRNSKSTCVVKSWLTRDCDEALYANLDETATCAVCIGTETASLALSSDVIGFGSQTTTSTENTQPGVISGVPEIHYDLGGGPLRRNREWSWHYLCPVLLAGCEESSKSGQFIGNGQDCDSGRAGCFV
jgi:hypothetical protein